MNSAVQAPMPRTSIAERVPLRMIVFIGVVLLLIGYPVYVYVDSVASGGVKELGNGVKEVDLKAMSNFTFDQQRGTIDDVPAKWRSLDGAKVVLYGEMWAPLDASNGGLGGFDLCYSIAKCCFNGPPL